jgi:hypothetical protein
MTISMKSAFSKELSELVCSNEHFQELTMALKGREDHLESTTYVIPAVVYRS